VYRRWRLNDSGSALAAEEAAEEEAEAVIS
jgi:hypothetical protein